MLKHPEEDRYSKEVRKSLEAQFGHAERTYSHWLKQKKKCWLAQSRLSDHVLCLAMTLNVQICRLFRSIIDDCSRCESYTANILSRSLFETILALQFILKSRVYIFVEPHCDKTTKAHLKDSDGDLQYISKTYAHNPPTRARPSFLSRDLRAHLYVSHDYFDSVRLTKECAGIDGLKRVARSRKKAEDPNVPFTIRNTIGEEWFSILKHKKSYSGLKVEQLAIILNRPRSRWYKTVYHIQSRMVHATDALQHVQEHPDGRIGPKFFSTEDEVSTAMLSATALFLAGLFILQENIGFGDLNDTVIRGLNDEFKTMQQDRRSR